MSCNEHRDGLLLKTVAVPDLVLIDEESSQLVWSKDLRVICMDPESTRNKLLVTRCCKQFAHIYCLRKQYCITEMCSMQNYSDEIAAKLHSENCFDGRSGLQREAPLDDFIVRHLIPEINADANKTRIHGANTTLSRLCAAFTPKISRLLSNCRAGYLRCTFAIGR